MHEMKKFAVAVALGVLAVGCDGLMFGDGDGVASFDDSLLTSQVDGLEKDGGVMRHGVVTWELVDATCPPEITSLWQGQGEASFLQVDDRITMRLDHTADVTGQLVAGRANVAGELVFMGQSEDIACAVDGDLEVMSDEITGELTEALSSPSEVNCHTTARYTVRLLN